MNLYLHRLKSLKKKGMDTNFLRGDNPGAALEVWEDKPAKAPAAQEQIRMHRQHSAGLGWESITRIHHNAQVQCLNPLQQ